MRSLGIISPFLRSDDPRAAGEIMESLLLTIGFLAFVGILLYVVPRLCATELSPPPLKRCHTCHALAVEPAVIDYTLQVLRNGELKWYTIKGLRIPICRDCGARSFTVDVDNQIEAEIKRQRNA